MKNLKNKKKGFTLIELIIVIAIIAILAAVAIPKFGAVRANANLKSDIANAKTIANAATALIAEGKIDDSDSPIIVDGSDEISGYLQNIPTPKSDAADNFTVTIDGNGGVTVVAGSKTFFPAATADVE